MAKVSKGREVALPNDTNELVEQLEREIAKYKDISEDQFKLGPSVETFTIKGQTDKTVLYRAWSMISGKKKAYDSAAEELNEAAGLGESYPVFTIGGGTADQWFADIVLQLKLLTNKDRMDKLKDFKKRAEEFLTEQDKKDRLLGEMKKFLGTDPQPLAFD